MHTARTTRRLDRITRLLDQGLPAARKQVFGRVGGDLPVRATVTDRCGTACLLEVERESRPAGEPVSPSLSQPRRMP